MIDETEATGELAELYSAYRHEWGVEEILKVHSLKPKTLAAHIALYETLMFGESGLSRAEREMIATVVSVANRCHY
jgi:uncharacterized peroxidase-related enzyme